MSVQLPTLPLEAQLKPRLIGFGADLTPPLGGPTLRVRRLGSRFALDVGLPAMDACGDVWIAACLQAEASNDTLSLVWPRTKARDGLPAPAVGAAGQAGSTLQVSALTKPIPALSFFSFTANGRSYLHAVTAPAAAGATILTIAPMLRASPSSGQPLNFAAPVVEGYATGNATEWAEQLMAWRTLSFTLQENA